MGNTGFRLAMRLVGPALLVWILWRFGDVDTLIDTFGAASPLPVIAAILLNVVAIHAKLWRWHDLLR